MAIGYAGNTGSSFGYGTDPGRMLDANNLGDVPSTVGGIVGAALGTVGGSFLPGFGNAVGGAFGGAVGGYLGNTLLSFFDEEEEEQQMVQQRAPTPYLPQPMPYQSPGMPQNLSQQYGVQNPYGFG
tara:strand:+ start:1137 stop:1514 length:378 start_codon:yes stop_codon:yes gene_type:complete